VGGAPIALTRTLFHVVNRSINHLDPKTADSVMRQWKKGSIGLGLMAIGYFFPQYFGGYYAGEKQEKGAPKFTGIRVFDIDIPRWMTHAPWFELMQIGATIRRVKEQHVKKTGEEKGLTEGMWAAGLGLIEQIPFVGQMLRFDKIFKPHERQQYIGELVKGTVVPGLVQKIAESTDWKSGREPDITSFLSGDIYQQRAPKDWLEYLKAGVPGFRQQVPEKVDKSEDKPFRRR
jgi:hypothetical protein